MWYVIVSFDFSDSSNVRIHALTPDLEKAEQVYRVLASDPKFISTEKEDSFHILLEMLEFPESFIGETGAQVFWDWTLMSKYPEVKVLFSNNRTPEHIRVAAIAKRIAEMKAAAAEKAATETATAATAMLSLASM